LVEWNRIPQEIIDASNRFDPGKATSCNYERQKRRTFRTRTFGISFFQVRDQSVTQVDRVAERFHC
jgi:hypothetical protein